MGREDDEMVMPGDRISITAVLACPVAMERGTGFSISEGDHTVALGTVTAVYDVPEDEGDEE